MMTTRKMPPPAAQGDIVESELRDMLQAVADARGGWSVIHQLLHGARTMAEIRTRFARWQAGQRDNNKSLEENGRRPRDEGGLQIFGYWAPRRISRARF